MGLGDSQTCTGPVRRACTSHHRGGDDREMGMTYWLEQAESGVDAFR